MTETSVGAPRRRGGGHRALWIVALLVLELAGLAVAYQVLARFECAATGAAGTCVLLRSFVARGITVLAAFAIYARARPQALAGLLAGGASAGTRSWAAVHLAGVLLMIVPLGVAGSDGLHDRFMLALGPWLAGGVAAAAGALFWLAPPRAWARWLRAERGLPAVVLAGALVIPDLGIRALPLWDVTALTRSTFRAVHELLRLFGQPAAVQPEAYLIGLDGFVVHIAHYCSGVEGFVLVTGFMALHALLFRGELRLARYWLVVLPAALALSWILNVVRLAGLIAIGAHVSPELAIGGFHSYAGWMFFTVLALGVVLGVQAVPFLWRAPRETPVGSEASGCRDAGSRILPFMVFMLASVVTAALSPVPDLAYPVKVLALLGVLLAFVRRYRGLATGVDPVAVTAGVAVGVLWLATLPAPTGNDALELALAGLPPALLLGWIACRLVGTVLLVPMVEELFFRGYVLSRLDGNRPWQRVAATAVSSALFALLHGRWLAAGLAGLVFALVMLRRGRLGDAILAHAAANFVVAAWALARGDWSAI